MERKNKRRNYGKRVIFGAHQVAGVSEALTPRRGDIWYADLGDHTGTSVQGGCRPVLILSNDASNTYSGTVNVVTLTRHLKRPDLPCHTLLKSDNVETCYRGIDDSMLLAEQLTTIGVSQLRGFVGRVEDKEVLARIHRAVIAQLSL